MKRDDRPRRWGEPDLTRFGTRDSDVTRREGVDPDATRYEGRDPDATRYEGADPDATRHEGAGRAPDATRYEGRAPSGFFGSLPARVVERYEWLRLLSNEGGQADVHLCRDRRSGQEVAVKVYRGRPKFDQVAYERIRSVDPAHVAPILDLEHDPDGVWEAQEYFPQGSLRDLMGRRGGGPQDPAWVRQVVVEITLALQAVHARNVTHRDLKPGNIFVRSTRPLDLVLGDFGVARDITMSVEPMSFAGSYRYTAPEVLSAGEAGAAADWWSLGVLTFELLTGHTPFLDDAGRPQLNEYRMKADIIKGHYSLADVTDARWSLLLRGLLNRSREHRWDESQVLAWQAGRSPAVVEAPERPAAPLTLRPLTLPGGTVSDPAAAARSLAANWASGCDYLSGQGSTHLRLWLNETPMGTSADALLRAVHDQGMTADEALVLLQLLLDPGGAVVFRGRPVDAATLAEVARGASGRDAQAQEWIRALRKNQVLGAMASRGRGGADLAAADLRLKRLGESLDRLITQAKGVPGLREHVAGLDGPAEGVLLAAALDASRADQHLKAAREVAGRVAPADPEPLRAWASVITKGGPDALPEALALKFVGEPTIDARLARAKVEADAARKGRREARLREIRNEARSLWRLVRTRLLLAAVPVIAAVLFLSDVQQPARWTPLAVALGVPLLISIALASAADGLFPRQRRARASFALGAALWLWAVFSAFPWPLSMFTPQLLTILVLQAPWFGGGYAAGHVVGALLGRFSGSGGRSAPWPVGLLWLLALASTAVVAVITKFGIPLGQLPPPGLWYQVAGPLSIAPLKGVATTGPLLTLVDVGCLLALTFGGDTSRLGRQGQRVLWLVVSVGALLSVLSRLPLLAAGWSLALAFLVLAGGVALFANWAHDQ